MKIIDDNKEQLSDLCACDHVGKLYLFGSILNEKFNDKSDIDLLIQFSSINLTEYFDNYLGFKES